LIHFYKRFTFNYYLRFVINKKEDHLQSNE